MEVAIYYSHLLIGECGWVWLGKVRWGKARLGEAWCGRARYGKVWSKRLLVHSNNLLHIFTYDGI